MVPITQRKVFLEHLSQQSFKNISFKNSSIRVFNSTKEEHIFLKDLSGDFLIDKGEILAKASLVNYKTGKTSLELFSPKIDIGGLFHDDNIRISSEKLVIDSDLMNKFYPIFGGYVFYMYI